MGNARFANRFVCLHFDGVQLSENTEQWDTLGKKSQRWCVDKQIRNEPTQWKNTINASCKKGGEPSPNVKAMRWEVSKFLSDNITLSMILVIAIFPPFEEICRRGRAATRARAMTCRVCTASKREECCFITGAPNGYSRTGSITSRERCLAGDTRRDWQTCTTRRKEVIQARWRHQ